MKTVTAVLICIVFTLPLAAQPFNTLTPQEKNEGWRLLFDGKTTNGWHKYGEKGVIGSAWRIEDGALMLYTPERAGNKAKNGGDIVTDEVFSGDFEFKTDWKISKLANSGVFFFVAEDPQYPEAHSTGLELQVTDNAIFGEGPDNSRRAGDIFGVVSAKVREARPVGEWNQMHVISRQGKLDVFLNGYQIHEIRLNSPQWKSWMEKSSLKDAPVGKGVFSGRIGLQDWGSAVWYRNIKYRQL
jgi:hypothetical protein